MRKEFLKLEDITLNSFLIFESDAVNCLDFNPFNNVYSHRFKQLSLLVKDRGYET